MDFFLEEIELLQGGGMSEPQVLGARLGVARVSGYVRLVDRATAMVAVKLQGKLFKGRPIRIERPEKPQVAVTAAQILTPWRNRGGSGAGAVYVEAEEKFDMRAIYADIGQQRQQEQQEQQQQLLAGLFPVPSDINMDAMIARMRQLLSELQQDIEVNEKQLSLEELVATNRSMATQLQERVVYDLRQASGGGDSQQEKQHVQGLEKKRRQKQQVGAPVSREEALQHWTQGRSKSRGGREFWRHKSGITTWGCPSELEEKWASRHYHKHEWKKALAGYRRAMAILDTQVAAAANCRLHSFMGGCYLHLRMPADAVKEFEAALALEPDNDNAAQKLEKALDALTQHGSGRDGEKEPPGVP
jgi:hypothetical protein